MLELSEGSVSIIVIVRYLFIVFSYLNVMHKEKKDVDCCIDEFLMNIYQKRK